VELDLMFLKKTPPHSLEAEKTVLGGVLVHNESLNVVLSIITPEDFYKEAHQAITDLSTREYPVDLYTVTEELRIHDELESVGGPVYLTQLTAKVVSAANVDYHARIVAQKYIQRELIRASTEILNRSFDDSVDVNELIDFSENELFQIAEGNIKREVSPINVVIKEAIREIEEAGKKGGCTGRDTVRFYGARQAYLRLAKGRTCYHSCSSVDGENCFRPVDGP